MNGIWTAVLVVLALWLIGFGGSSETRTIYFMRCDTPIKDGQCRGKATPLRKDTVRIFPESQRVIRASVVTGAWSFGKCTVFDGDNWTCEHEDGSATTNMVDGRYLQFVSNKLPTAIREEQEKQFQVSPVRFWIAMVRQYF